MLKVTLESHDSESPDSRFRIADSVPLRPGIHREKRSCGKCRFPSDSVKVLNATLADATLVRARKRHINFEHINFLKVETTLGQPAGWPEGKVYISCVSRRTHKLFGPVSPGTTSRLSQGHLEVNRSKKFMFMCLFSPGLVFEFLVQFYFRWWVHLRKKKKSPLSLIRSGQTSVLQTSVLEMLQCPPRSEFSLNFATWRNKYFNKGEGGSGGHINHFSGGFAAKPRSTWSRSAFGLSWTKAASIPARQQSEDAAQGVRSLFFFFVFGTLLVPVCPGHRPAQNVYVYWFFSRLSWGPPTARISRWKNFVSSLQGAAKGGRQKEFDHFFSFSGHFWSLFLMLLSLFWSLFCQTPLLDSFWVHLRNKKKNLLSLKRHLFLHGSRAKMQPKVAILRACYRARKPQNPENTKKIQNPPPRVGPPKIREKIPKKYKNGLKIAVFRPFLYFFGIFSVFSGGRPGVGDLVFFFVFSGFWGFRAL